MPRPCKYAEEGCKFIGKKDNRAIHEEKDCKLRRVKCMNSEYGCTVSEKKDIIDGHEKNCNFRQIECPYAEDGCNFMGKKDVVRRHVSNCSHRKIKCKYFIYGCSFSAKKDIMRGHESACSHKKIECKYSGDGCGFIGKKGITYNAHVHACNFRKVKCPEVKCAEMIVLRRITDHIKSKHAITYVGRGESHGRHIIFYKWGGATIPRYWHSLSIITFAGFTFIPMLLIENGVWRIWTIMVGERSDAQNFCIEINIRSKDSDCDWTCKAKVALNFKGKVYSIHEGKSLHQKVEEDAEGVLEFTQGMAKKMLEYEGDQLGIRVQYVVSKMWHDTLLGPESRNLLPPESRNLPHPPHPREKYPAPAPPQRPQALSSAATPQPRRAPRIHLPWVCHVCTFENTSSNYYDICEVCENPRVFASPEVQEDKEEEKEVVVVGTRQEDLEDSEACR